LKEIDMANEIKLATESRTEFGKGASRRIRREGKVPAVLYGHGTDPVHLTLPAHETLLALRTANALLALDIEGTKQLALPKQVQRDPIRGTLEHLDLVVVRTGEKVTVEIQVTVVGEPAGDDLIVNVDQQTVSLEVLATNIPQHIEVSVEGFVAGQHVTAADLTLPEGAVYMGEPTDLVVAVSAPRAESEESAEAGATAEAAE